MADLNNKLQCSIYTLLHRWSKNKQFTSNVNYFRCTFQSNNIHYRDFWVGVLGVIFVKLFIGSENVEGKLKKKTFCEGSDTKFRLLLFFIFQNSIFGDKKFFRLLASVFLKLPKPQAYTLFIFFSLVFLSNKNGHKAENCSMAYAKIDIFLIYIVPSILNIFSKSNFKIFFVK